MKRFFTAVFIPFCIVSMAAAVSGGTYYIAPGGSDSDPGTESQPFGSIQKAADLVDPGDVVIVKDGIYTDTDNNDFVVFLVRGGTPGNRVTFRSENKWCATLNGAGVGHSCFALGNISYVTVEGFEMVNAFWGGFWSNAGASHIIVRGNRIHRIGNRVTGTTSGISGIFEGEAASYHTYDGNVIHDIGRTGGAAYYVRDHGIYNSGDHTRITNNIIYDCIAGWGVHMAGYDTVDDVVVSNNVFAFGGNCGHLILWQPCHNVTVQNNIFFMPAVPNSINFLDTDFQNIVIRNNLVFGGGLKDSDDNGACLVTDNIEGADPLFTDGYNYDFHLSQGSPAIDAGIAADAPDTDFEGSSRPSGPAHDIGAYEFLDQTALAFFLLNKKKRGGCSLGTTEDSQPLPPAALLLVVFLVVLAAFRRRAIRLARNLSKKA